MNASISAALGLIGRRTKTRPAPGIIARPRLPSQLGRLCAGDLERLERLTEGTLLIQSGDFVARYGYPFRDMYAVRSGRIQASITDVRGRVRLLGEFAPGDVIGFDALRRGTYPADFVALETSTVCRVPLHMLDGLAAAQRIQ